MKIVIPAEKLAAAVNKYLIPAFIRAKAREQAEKTEQDKNVKENESNA